MKLDYTKRTTEPVQTETNLPNYAEALRQLKQADALIEKKKKQLRVQAMRAQRGSWIDQQAEHRAQLKKQAQESNEKLVKEFKALRTKQLQSLKQLRKKSQISKHESFKNRQRSRLEALENKIKMNQQIRLKSQQHGQRIRKYHLQQIEMKKSRCLEKYNSKKMSRVNIDNFQQSRISELKYFQSRERDDLLQRLKIKKQELSKLDQSNSLQNVQSKRNEPSTSDLKSFFGTELPYKNANSSYMKKRKKCSSQSKIDSNRHPAMIFS